MHCPNCNDAMECVVHTSHMGTRVEIDVCGPCHVIWFDSMESASLSPGSVIELFKRIHAARGGARNTLKTVIGCPLCATTMNSVTDLAKGGRFTYLRCVSGHGRLTSYVQFLREKNFIRSLQPHEIAALSVKIKQIRCSSCGGPISLESDKACTHCGAAISVLDEAAVEKALVTLQAREIDRTTIDPNALGDALLTNEANARRIRRLQSLPHNQSGSIDWLSDLPTSGGIADLIELGIGAALAALRD